MAFETKILDRIHCPRCNAMAEQRIDVHKTNSKLVLVYTVCPMCKLNRYSHTTTRKAVNIHARINRIKKRHNYKGKKKLESRVKYLERLEAEAEREF